MNTRCVFLLAAVALSAGTQPDAALLRPEEVAAAFRNLPRTPPTNREIIVQEH